MKSWFLFFGLPGFLAISLVASELPVASPSEIGLCESRLKEVDRFMEKAIADQKMAGGIVVISHQGKIGHFGVYGKQDLAADKPMKADTIFRIYSMSKAITTAAALMLVEEGKVGLQDPVSKFIPSFADLKVAAPEGIRPPKSVMTVQDLMLHTAGLTYGSGPEGLKEAYSRLKPMESANLEEMVHKLSQVPLAFDPGTDWVYGVAIDVLGRVIEVASGMSLDQFLQKRIFAPLDMRDTSFSVPPEKHSRFAVNYRRSSDGLQVIDTTETSKFAMPTTFFSGGGGLLSTARDYMRFLTMIAQGGHLDGRCLLKPETVRLMTTNQLPKEAFPIYFGEQIRYGTGFGLGFSVRTEITSWDPAGHVGEYGWGGAASTHYWVSPKDQLIVVTLEQIMPYQWDTEFGLKPMIYQAISPVAAEK